MPTVSRRRVAALGIAMVLALALDLRQAPSDRWSTAAAVGGIHVYQGTFAKLHARLGAQCRFTLSCSHYGEAVIKKYGAFRGGWMAAKRVFRCGPWTPMGSVDNPPG